MNDPTQILKEIKKDFYIYRNGILAENLKTLYPPGTLIFGLNVPQFMELAKKYPKDKELAFHLWKDKSSRESRLFALYVYPPKEMKLEEANSMINDVRSIEEAEFLAFRLLRHVEFAKELYRNQLEKSICSEEDVLKKEEDNLKLEEKMSKVEEDNIISQEDKLNKEVIIKNPWPAHCLSMLKRHLEPNK